MPAASCRIMPARSIRRCDTISASLGFSFRIGRRNRDNRMGKPDGIGETREGCSESGSAAKTQGRGPRKPLGPQISVVLLAILTARLRRERVTIRCARAPSHLQTGLANDLFHVHLAAGVVFARG